jgi:O-antigen ligase
MSVGAPAVRWRELSRRPGRAGVAGLLGLAALAVWIGSAPLAWALALPGLVGLALVIAIAPVAGLVVLALLIPFGGAIPLPLPGANGVDALILPVVAGWLARQVAHRAVIFRPPPLALSLAALVWLLALSLTQAHSWREGLPELLKWAEFALLYIAATQILGNERAARWVVGALLAAGLIQVVLGAYQFWGQVGPPAFALPGGHMRAHGAFRQPNPYAGYLGYLAPVAASLAVAGLWRWLTSRSRRDLAVGLICGAAALLLAAGIGMSWSRGGWLALAAALLAVIALRNQRTALLTLAAGAVLIGVIGVTGIGWLPGPIAERLHDLGSYLGGPDPARTEITDANFAVLERLAHWQAGLDMFRDHPWLGVGIGNFSTAYEKYALPHWYEPLGHAHNIFINFLAETGVAGAGAFVLVGCGAWRLSWRTARRTARRGAVFASALPVGVLGVLTYLSVHGLFDNLFVQHMQLQLALLLACVAIIYRNEATF